MIIKFMDLICLWKSQNQISRRPRNKFARKQTDGINKHVIYTYIICYNQKLHSISAIRTKFCLNIGLYAKWSLCFSFLCSRSIALNFKIYLNKTNHISVSLSSFSLCLSVASQTWAFATIWRARSARRSDVRTIASPTSIRVSSMALRWSMCTMRKSQSRIQRLRWVFHAYQHTKSILIRDLHTCICRLEPFPSCDCCQHQDQEEIKKKHPLSLAVPKRFVSAREHQNVSYPRANQVCQLSAPFAQLHNAYRHRVAGEIAIDIVKKG